MCPETPVEWVDWFAQKDILLIDDAVEMTLCWSTVEGKHMLLQVLVV